MLVFFVCLSTGFDLGYSLTVYCFGPMFIAIGPTKKISTKEPKSIRSLSNNLYLLTQIKCVLIVMAAILPLFVRLSLFYAAFIW